MISSLHGEVRGDEFVICRQPWLGHVARVPLGLEVRLEVIGHASDASVQAVAVGPPAWLAQTTEPCAAITLSLASPAGAAAAAAAMLAAAMSGLGHAKYMPLGASSFCVCGRLGLRMGDGSVLFDADELCRREGLEPGALQQLAAGPDDPGPDHHHHPPPCSPPGRAPSVGAAPLPLLPLPHALPACRAEPWGGPPSRSRPPRGEPGRERAGQAQLR
jgi:hypothetical protein